MTICSYHVTYAFQSEFTLYRGLNVKELLGRSRRKVRSLSDCNWTRTYNHLVHKRTLNHLDKLTIWLSCVVSTYLYGALSINHTQFNHLASFAKWSSVRSWTKWLWVRVQLQSTKLQISRLLWARSSLTLSNCRVWIHSETRRWHDKNIQSNAPYR